MPQDTLTNLNRVTKCFPGVCLSKVLSINGLTTISHLDDKAMCEHPFCYMQSTAPLTTVMAETTATELKRADYTETFISGAVIL